MAQANIGSRRASETLIEQGRVTLNGVVATLGDKADPEVDVIEVDGERLKFDQRKMYIMVNKPQNVLTSSVAHHDDDRRTIFEFVPFEAEHLFTIGRLDADSEGMVVLTNDGELANKLTHPRYRHTKVYRVVVEGLPTAETVDRWQRGVYLEEDGMTAPCLVEITKGGHDQSTLRVVMTEGKKRQIRRVASLLGHPVHQLKRVQIGMLEMGDLKPGEWRELTSAEVQRLSQRAPEAKAILQIRPAPSTRTDASDRPLRPRAGDLRDRPPRRDGDDRPRRPRSFDENAASSDRPRRPYGERSSSSGDRPPRRDNDDRPPRPRFSQGGSSPNRGDNRPRRPNEGDRPTHPYRNQGDTPPRADRPRRNEDDDDT